MKKIKILLIVVSIIILCSCDSLNHNNVVSNNIIDNYIEYKTFRCEYIIKTIDANISEDSEVNKEESFETYCINKLCNIMLIEPSRQYVQMTYEEKTYDFYIGFVQVRELEDMMKQEKYSDRIEYLLKSAKEGRMNVYLPNDIYLDELEIIESFSNSKDIDTQECLEKYVYYYYYYSYDLSYVVGGYEKSKNYKSFDMVHPLELIYEKEINIDDAYEYADIYYTESQKIINDYYDFLGEYVEELGIPKK